MPSHPKFRPFSSSLLAALVASTALLTPGNLLACTGLIVGGGASENGAIIISRNEDFYVNNWAKYMVVRPAATNEEGAKWDFGSGLEIPKPARMMKYTAMPDWNSGASDSGAGPFEEVGINTANVAITATVSAGANDKAKAADPFVSPGIDESVLPTLLLSQAKSASEAVDLVGRYIETYGAAEANGLAVADTSETWLIEIGSAHHWIAVKVPRDVYIVQANALRVHGVDLNDTENVRHSTGLVEHVEKHGLLEEVDATNFDFARAFGVLNDPYNTDRVWLAQHILTPSVEQEIRAERYPLFMRPDKKISVLDIARVLRANYEGTPLEGKADRLIGVDRNIESHIIEMRADKPDPIKGVIWQSIGNVDDSLFIPIYGGIQDTPEAYRTGTDTFSEDSAYWVFRSIGALLNFNDGAYREDLHKLRDEAEQNLLVSLPYMDAVITEMLAQDEALGMDFLNTYSNGLALRALERARQIRAKLMTEITKSTEKEYSREDWEKITKL